MGTKQIHLVSVQHATRSYLRSPLVNAPHVEFESENARQRMGAIRKQAQISRNVVCIVREAADTLPVEMLRLERNISARSTLSLVTKLSVQEIHRIQ